MRNTETAVESVAIRALGSLFRITESFLWDDAFVGVSEAPVHHDNLVEEPTDLRSISFAGSKTSSTLNNYISLEDLELAQQMDALGLPVSFSTNKEKRIRAASGKRKGMVAKSISAVKDIGNKLTEVSRESEHVNLDLSQVFQDSVNTTISHSSTKDIIETSHDNFKEEHSISSFCLDAMVISVPDDETIKELDCRCKTEVLTTDKMACVVLSENMYLKKNDEDVNPANVEFEKFPDNALEGAGSGHHQGGKSDFKQDKDKILGSMPTTCFTIGCKNASVDIGSVQMCSDSYESSEISSMQGHGFVEDFVSSKCSGDWMVVWDSFYMRNFFYNVNTHESTWYPPPGFEYLAVSSKPNEMLADAAEQDFGLGSASGAFIDQDVCTLQENDLFEEIINDGKLSSQPSQEATLSSSLVSECSDMASDSSKCMDEHVRESDYPEIIKRSESPIPLYPSGDEDHSERFTNRHNQVDSEKHWRSDELATGEKSKPDELDVNKPLDNLEGNIACQEAWNVLDDVTHEFHLNNSFSSTTTHNEISSEENWRSMQEMHMTSTTNDLNSNQDTVSVKMKARVRRIRSHKLIPDGNKEHTAVGIVEGLSADIVKYWCQRYLLFSKFDKGVKMDQEGWFSVTPEAIARHHALRCGSGIVIDCFTGVGGNAIQFAMKSNHVIAIDIDPQKINYARHNATIYGVNDCIDFMQGDFFCLATNLKGDTVFLSPPWGGPEYARVQAYDIRTMLKPRDGYFLFEIAKMIAPRVVMFLPRNVDIDQLAELLLAHPPWELEVEKNYLNGKLKGITAYFSDASR